MTRLHRTLSTVEYFTFGFGTMIGVGWLVLIDDWLSRGGPVGAMLGFLLGGLMLLPVARCYGRLVQMIPDAGAEIAYTRDVLPPWLSFAAGWFMVLAYAVVCPWEAVAVGNLLARLWPELNSLPLYAVAGRTIFLPRLGLGLLMTAAITWINYRGSRHSGRFQNVATFGLLSVFVLLVLLGGTRGDPALLRPAFAHSGTAGTWLSILLVLQIIPYYMGGFETVARASEEARPGYQPRGFARAIYLALGSGTAFYVLIVAVVALLLPWQEVVRGRVGTERVFEQAFGSRPLTRLILFGAFLSLLKVFNGVFVASCRLLFALGREGLLSPFLSRVHPRYGSPHGAILLTAALTVLGTLLGDTVLVPITEVGSLAAAGGWLAASLSLGLHGRKDARVSTGDFVASGAGIVVSLGLIGIKIAPWVPGSFTRAEWAALAAWLVLGAAFWSARPRT